MALGGIQLGSAMRGNLGSLQSTQEKIGAAQLRLSTGRKINSALDGALNFFTSQGLEGRAKALSTVQDNIGQGMKVIEQADRALNGMKTMLESLQGQLKQALQAQGTNAKATTTQKFVNQVTGNVDGSQSLVGSGSNQFNTGDVFTFNLGGADTVTFTVAAGSTANDLVNAINAEGAGATFINKVGQAPKIRAYLNDAGNVVIENSTAVTGGTGNDLTVRQTTDAGAANVINTVFSFNGDPDAPTAPTGAAGAQTAVTRGRANTTRATVAETFRTTIDQIGKLARDAGYNGTNLLNGETLRVGFNVEDTTSLVSNGVIFDAAGLGFNRDNTITSTGDTFFNLQSDREIKLALKQVTAATTRVIDQNASYASNLNIIKTRADFTRSSVKNFDEGADILVQADINEEGASLLALQTRQQLGVQALSLASQSEQAVLRLF